MLDRKRTTEQREAVDGSYKQRQGSTLPLLLPVDPGPELLLRVGNQMEGLQHHKRLCRGRSWVGQICADGEGCSLVPALPSM